MGVELSNLGNHTNVFAAKFGEGEQIYILTGTNNDGSKIVGFWNVHELEKFIKVDNGDGLCDVSNQASTVSLNDLPAPEIMLSFRNPYDITAIIRELANLQLDMFRQQLNKEL